MALQDSAMLVKLTITQWSARKLDRKVSQEICTTKHAKKGSGNFNKQLIPKEYLKDIQTLVGNIRNYHYQNTLSWNQDGTDILPSEMFFEYSQQIAKYKEEFNNEVIKFVKEYETKILTKVAGDLQDLYNAADYPTPNRVKQKFNMTTSFMPVPDSRDFRIQLEQEALTDLKNKLNVQMDQVSKSAESELFNRLYTVVSKVVIKLQDPDAIFRDSLIDNVIQETKKTAGLNINKNQNLNTLADSIHQYAIKLILKRLRTFPDYRTAAYKEFKKYLKLIDIEHNRSQPNAQITLGT